MTVCEWICERCKNMVFNYSGNEICHTCKLKFGEPFKPVSFWNRLRGKYE